MQYRYTHTLARSGLLAYLGMFSLETSTNGPSGSVSMEAVPSLTWRPEAVVTGLEREREQTMQYSYCCCAVQPDQCRYSKRGYSKRDTIVGAANMTPWRK